MKKIKFSLSKIILLSAFCIITILPNAFAQNNVPVGAKGYLLKDIFSNGKKHFSWNKYNNGAYFDTSKADDLQSFSPSGTPSLLFKGVQIEGTTLGKEILTEAMPAYIILPCVDFENTALQFEINVKTVTEELYIGLTCWGNQVSGLNPTVCGGILRISLEDYLSNLGYKNGDWIKVTIPFKYFMENGEFLSRETGDGAITEFDYSRTNGIYFAASTERFTHVGHNIIFTMMDNVRFIEYVNSPERITVTKNGKGVDVSWSASQGAEAAQKYNIYRKSVSSTDKAELIASVNADVHHYTDTDVTGGTYNYYVVAVNETYGFVSLPVKSAEITTNSSDGEPQSNTASAVISKVSLYDCKGDLLSDGNDSTYIDNVETIVDFSGKGFLDGVLKTELYRNGVLADFSETIVSEPAGISAEYNENHRYVTLLPGEYVFKTAVYVNDSPVTDVVENKFTVADTQNKYTLTVNTDSEQTMDGWGFNPYTENKDYTDWEELEDVLMKNLGANMTRHFVPYDSVDENGNITEQFDWCIKVIEYSVRNDIEKYILTFSPYRDSDKWIENSLVNYWEANGWIDPYLKLKRNMEEEYIDTIISRLKRIQDEGLPLPYAVNIQNEPTNSKVTFIYPEQYKRLIKLLDKKLKGAEMDSVNILAFETVAYSSLYHVVGDSGIKNADGNGYLPDFYEFSRDKDYLDAVDIVGVHSYDAPTDKETSKQLAQNYKNTLEKYGKTKWMTEFSLCGKAASAHTNPELGLDYDMEALFREITGLLGDVVWAGNSAWFHHAGYWSLDNLTEYGYAYAMNGDPNSPFTNGLAFGTPGARKIRTGNVYAALSLIFKNAPKGSVVKKVTTDWEEINNSPALLSDLGAFENGNSTVVVLVNQTKENAYITLNNLKGTKAEVNTLTTTSLDANVTSSYDVASGSIYNVFIPSKSVNIIISK